ncbi:hypothetical protein DIPPA_35001 [Diplonema papillatum]|nr:hypothetical protein DIPPA_35001 [Diplonema papillatum]
MEAAVPSRSSMTRIDRVASGGSLRQGSRQAPAGPPLTKQPALAPRVKATPAGRPSVGGPKAAPPLNASPNPTSTGVKVPSTVAPPQPQAPAAASAAADSFRGRPLGVPSSASVVSSRRSSRSPGGGVKLAVPSLHQQQRQQSQPPLQPLLGDSWQSTASARPADDELRFRSASQADSRPIAWSGGTVVGGRPEPQDVDLVEMQAHRGRILAEVTAIQEQLQQGERGTADGSPETTAALRQRLAVLKLELRKLQADVEYGNASPWRGRWARQPPPRQLLPPAANPQQHPLLAQRPSSPEAADPGKPAGHQQHGNLHPPPDAAPQQQLQQYEFPGPGPVARPPGVAGLYTSPYAELQMQHHDSAVESLRQRQVRESDELRCAFEEKARELELRHRDQQAYQAEQIRREQEHFVAYQTALAKAEAAKRELEVASHDLRDFESNWITSSTLYRPTMAGTSSKKQEVTPHASDLLAIVGFSPPDAAPQQQQLLQQQQYEFPGPGPACPPAWGCRCGTTTARWSRCGSGRCASPDELRYAFEKKAREIELRHRDQQAYQAEQIRVFDPLPPHHGGSLHTR